MALEYARQDYERESIADYMISLNSDMEKTTEVG